MSHNDSDKAKDEDEHPAVRRHLRSLQRFVTDMLPEHVPQLDH